MTKEQIKKDLKQSTKEILALLDRVPEHEFNASPKNGGWTIGQVTEHLIKVETSAVRLFSGSAEATDRDPEKKIRTIRERFLDFETKMKAFGPIVPTMEKKDKRRAMEKIQDIRQKLASFIEIQDMTDLVTGFAHPLFGPLTKVEWIYFNIYHSQRHANQIKEIRKELEQR